MRPVALDTETHLIGPGAVVPRLVCCSFADEDEGALYATADAELEPLLRAILEDETRIIVAHNMAFDACVLMKHYPEHEALWWRAMAAGRVTCTLIREQLLNLSESGRLDEVETPDGTTTRLRYGLADLIGRYFGEAVAGKDDDEMGARHTYAEWDGTPAAQYDRAHHDYALADARYCYRVHEAQAARAEVPPSSVATDAFRTAASVALLRITERGMATDPVEFERMRAHLASELSDSRLQPLFASGILRPAVPSVPHKRHEPRARELVAEWVGIAPEDVRWERLDSGLRQALLDAGLKMKAGEDPTKCDAALRHRVLAVAAARAGVPLRDSLATPLEELVDLAATRGVPYKRTPKGAISTADEVVAALAPEDEPLAPGGEPPLQTFLHRQRLQKLVTTELPRMTWDGELSPVVHFPFRALVETGRTSSYATPMYPSANGQNVDPRARGVFVPRPGYVLCSTDYSTLELACVAQVTYDLFGESVHRDKILAGYDLHAYLGTVLAEHLDPAFQEKTKGMIRDQAYHYFKSLEFSDGAYYKRWRKLAKPVGLGLPGGLGPWKLVELARKAPYDVDVIALAEERFEAHPEEFEATPTVLHYARVLHRMKDADFRWTPQLKGVALAARLRDIWYATYPEMRRYLTEWVPEQGDPWNETIAVYRDEETGEYREVRGLCYTTPFGMRRGGATFTAVANGRAMQSPAAEGFMTAVFDLVRACCDPASESILRGNAHVVDEVHDEVIVEVKEDVAHELAEEIRKIMEAGMRAVLTDVPVSASPCLMRRWNKDASPVFDGDRMVPWEPNVKYVERDKRRYVS